MEEFEQLRGGVLFTEKFPTTPLGQVLRRELAEMAKVHKAK